jgi:RNA polymerase sigma-70 factor, ECF subfamily
MPGDHALMRAFAVGDRGAAEVLYDRYASRIYGLGVALLRSADGAEDLVQDAFMKLLRTAGSYDPERGPLDTYVLLVARSLAVDTLRRRARETRMVETTRRGWSADPEPGPDRLAEARDLASRARAALAGLSDGQRAALELAYFAGKTPAEVARLEAIPFGTAKTRIRAALLRLRKVLADDPR